MQHLLTNTKQLTLGPWKHDTNCELSVYFFRGVIFFLFSVEEKKEKTLNSILKAKNKIKTDIASLKDRLKLAKETITKFKDEIAKLQAQQGSGYPG